MNHTDSYQPINYQIIINTLISLFGAAIITAVSSSMQFALTNMKIAVSRLYNKFYTGRYYVRSFEFDYSATCPTRNQHVWDQLVQMSDDKHQISIHGHFSAKKFNFSPLSEFTINNDVYVHATFVERVHEGKSVIQTLVYLKSLSSESLTNTIQLANNKIDRHVIYLYQTKASRYNHGFGIVNKAVYVPTKCIDDIYLPYRDLIVENLDMLLSGKKSHLNMLLHGEPGCGKTSLINAIINYTKWSATVINLKNIVDEDLRMVCSTNRNESISQNFDLFEPQKHIYIIEEIERHNNIVLKPEFKSDEVNDDSSEKKNKLSLSSILNLLQGLVTPAQSIFIITTNHREWLEPAIYRPGRIHLDLELKRMLLKHATQMICKVYPHFTESKLIDYGYQDFDINPCDLENMLEITNSEESFLAKLQLNKQKSGTSKT